MQFSKKSEVITTNISETRKSISATPHLYFGIYSRDPFEVAKTITRPRAPTFNKRDPSQWKIQATSSQKWDENQNSQDNRIDESLTPESPVLSSRHTLNYKSCNRRIVSLF